MANLLYSAAAIIALLAMLLTLIRLLKGPTIADRVVSLDVMTIISLSLIVYITALAERIIYFDVALVYGLISFLGIVAMARYLERGL